MPRGQKSKLHARKKRQQARGDTQNGGDIQEIEAAVEAAAAAVAAEEAAEAVAVAVEAAATSESLPSAQIPPDTELCSSPDRSSSPSLTSEDEQSEEDESIANTILYTSHSCPDLLSRKVHMLEQFLLHKYKMKQLTTKEDMLKVIDEKHRNEFAEILRKASQHLAAVFAVDVEEVNSTSHSYNLISKLKLPNNGRIRAGKGLPKAGLLMNVLGMIFMKGNCAAEEDIWKYLKMMRVYPGKKHYIYGEPRKLITKDLVKLKYLIYRQVADSDPPRFEFLWGPQAHAETSKMKVLKFLANINETDPSYYPALYKEALKDEEERAQTIYAAKPEIIDNASIIVPELALCPIASRTLVEV